MLNFTNLQLHVLQIMLYFTNIQYSCNACWILQIYTIAVIHALFYRWTCSTVCYIFCYNKFHLTMRTVRPSPPRAINEERKTTAPVGRKPKRRRKLCRRCSWTQTVSCSNEKCSYTWSICCSFKRCSWTHV